MAYQNFTIGDAVEVIDSRLISKGVITDFKASAKELQPYFPDVPVYFVRNQFPMQDYCNGLWQPQYNLIIDTNPSTQEVIA